MNDAVRATPVLTDGDAPGYLLTGPRAEVSDLVEALDGHVTDHSRPRVDGATSTCTVWCVWARETREGLADYLRHASDASGVDLVVEPDLGLRDTLPAPAPVAEVSP